MAGLSIIIPTKDRGQIFFKTLESVVAASSHINPEIIVVNNSVDKVQIPGKYTGITVYDNPFDKNSVFSSRNYGASLARNPILLFIDDDVIVSKESIDYALTFHNEHKHECFNVNWQYPPELLSEIKQRVFGRYLIKNGFTAMKSLYRGNWNDDKPFIASSIASFFFCILKEDFEQIGGYNEKHLHEGTDNDISNKLMINKITMWINPLIMVFHNEADRVELRGWLERKKRLGEISRNSLNMGDNSHKIHYSIIKTLVYRFIYAFQALFIGLLKVIDKLKADTIGFIIINALLGANICHGYNSIK